LTHTVGQQPTLYTLYLKKRTDFETVQLKFIFIDYDDTWERYSKDSTIEFACFSFHVCRFAFYQTGHQNNANFDAVSSKRVNFDDVQFF